MNIQLQCKFGLTLRKSYDRLGPWTTEVWSMFSLTLARVPRDINRDRPVVSETELIGRNDSPSLVGPNKGERSI